jgi:hypothetical protein
MVPSRDLEGFSAGEFIHLSDQMVTCTVFQREMMAATEKLYPLLGKSQGSTSWRNHTALFPSETEIPSGSLNLSPAWFQQGHEVSCFGMRDS